MAAKTRLTITDTLGAGLRSAEVCNLRIGGIVPEARLRHDDSDRMLIHVEQGKGRRDRKVMPSCRQRRNIPMSRPRRSAIRSAPTRC
jgi:hypothetical protein